MTSLGNYSRESILMRERFTERTQKTQILLKKVMERADRHVWRCDPTHHVEHETYETVTRLLQGYIENEVDMNNDGTCRENCAAYQFAENMGCYKDMYCSRQPKCTGKLLNCQFVDADMWVCPAVRTYPPKVTFGTVLIFTFFYRNRQACEDMST